MRADGHGYGYIDEKRPFIIEKYPRSGQVDVVQFIPHFLKKIAPFPFRVSAQAMNSSEPTQNSSTT